MTKMVTSVEQWIKSILLEKAKMSREILSRLIVFPLDPMQIFNNKMSVFQLVSSSAQTVVTMEALLEEMEIRRVRHFQLWSHL